MFQPRKSRPGCLLLPVCSDILCFRGHTPSSVQHQPLELPNKLPERNVARDLGLVLPAMQVSS